jgi:hypothetical protein
MTSLGAELLDELETMVGRFVAFPSPAALDAVVLWIVHAHAVGAAESTPRLAILSPERGSGKTRLLEVISQLVPDPLHAVNISPAALYRLVEVRQPTLLLDECDSYLGLAVAKQHEELRGLINAGHRRGATVYRGEISGRTVGVVEFQAYAACALAGIGDLPDTILDRSVLVWMKRRAPHERVEPFRERRARPEAEQLRERLAAWAEDHDDSLRDAWPPMPDGITDRAADVWEPLIAIADAAGGNWPQRARTAAVQLHSERAHRDQSLGTQLLADCHRSFAGQDSDRLTTKALLNALVSLEDAPWSDLRGKPLDARGLARRLRNFGVSPGDHRFHDGVRKGYRREDFHDAWLRYLPVAPVAPVAVAQDGGALREPVAPTEDEHRYDLPPNRHGDSVLPVGEGQHPLRPSDPTAADPSAVGDWVSGCRTDGSLTLDDVLHDPALYAANVAPLAELVEADETE